MSFTPTSLIILTIFVVLLPLQTYAFGAGDIPDFAYLNDKAFRHGDIENILETLVKSAGRAAAGGGLLSFAKSVIDGASGGPKFSKGDIKKVYFGNWLRDYSQAMDTAGLSKLSADTLVLVVSILGFMTFGFATEEFQVTADRLGVYLPVEHIDNPKGYAAKEGDARQFHPKLRPPVDERELEIDGRTGMKNYMATEGRGWDTSTAFIRRTFGACIEVGRKSGGRNGPELYEAYRLLGTGLHTLEDLLAHSNWCEIALRKLGHEAVFCHVGDNVIINTPNGPAPPLVTGTFGGADFIHSLMGEATDHLSQASVTDLSQKLDQASQGDNTFDKLKAIFSKLPIGGKDGAMNNGEEIHAQSKAYHFDPNNVAPPEVQRQLLALLKWRDGVYRDVVAKIEMVPGLSNLLDELTNALNAYVYTILSPYITPILQQATGVLGEGSKSVIESGDQFEVFDNPNASDPTHSLLSKDHFDLILNEPAGKIAQIVVQHAVNNIVRAWSDDNDPNRVIDVILEAFHHPYYASGRSNIQNQMFEHMDRWINGMGPQSVQTIIRRLTKDSVRNAENKREESSSGSHSEGGYERHTHGGSTQNVSSGYQSQQGHGGSGYQSQQEYSGQYQSQQSHGGSGYQSQQGYQSQKEYGGYQAQQGSAGSGHQSSYGRDDNPYSGRQESRPAAAYGRHTEDESRRFDSVGRNTDEGYGGSRFNTDYGRETQNRHEEYGRSKGRHTQRDDEEGQRYTGRDDRYGDSYGTPQGRSSYRESDHEDRQTGRHEYSSSRQGDADKYGSQREERSHRNETGGYAPSYNRSSYQDEHGGGTRRNEGSYEASGYSSSDRFASRGQQSHSRYGGDEETYGAERLNLGDDDNTEKRHHGRHQQLQRRSNDDEY